MKRIIVTYTLLFALPLYFGCSSLNSIQRDSWAQLKDNENKTDVIFIKTSDGNKYNLDWESISISQDSLFGSGSRISGEDSFHFEGSIALWNIYKIETEQFDILGTIFSVGLLAMIVMILLLAASDGMKSAAGGFRV